jgi:hypothetical protein
MNRTINGAEHLLNAGKARTAAKKILAAKRNAKKLVPNRRSAKNDRMLRILATAVIRMRGDFEGPRFLSKTQRQRAENVAWATHVLKALSLAKPKDAALQTSVAEALALSSHEQDIALAMLTTLAKEDRVTSPQGYAALARLHRERASELPAFVGAPLSLLNAPRVRLAEARCKQMSRNAGYCETVNDAG